MKKMRGSGILMHIASLPNRYGIGSLGREAYAFVDYLVKCGQSYWQILPLSPTSYGDSPYQSFSIHAGNPYFISLEVLEAEGLLKRADYTDIKWSDSPRYIDYGRLYKTIGRVFHKAFARFGQKESAGRELDDFIAGRPWVKDYGLFMALKEKYGGKPWNEWEKSIRNREKDAVAGAEKELACEIRYHCFLQFQFTKQWEKLKKYANEKGVKIIGDIPIYCAYDSVDVWREPNLFLLDKGGQPIVAAGFPPDGYSANGQLWGNPIYDWEMMKKENFHWWVERMAYAKKLYDIVRIDHFIGFERYYAIPFGNKTAAGGHWCKGPGWEVFAEIIGRTGKGGVIAEDLGIVTPAVRKLLKKTGYPGMKVLQFAFEPSGKSEYLPQNYTDTNCVVYTATHDNDTVAGWVSTNRRQTNRFCREYLGVIKNAQIPRGFIRLAWQSTARIAMTTIQELCGYGSEARINVPSTLGNNWRWRAAESDFTDENAAWLKHLTTICNRAGKEQKI